MGIYNAEVVKKVADNNGKFSTSTKHLAIEIQTLSNWQNKLNQGKLIDKEQYRPDVMAALEGIKQLSNNHIFIY